jgi:CheY-like chemotaxis protein/anti-sigma regulatory factor (Ser/Thr protein kinase)
MNAIIGMGELIRTDNLDDVQKNYLQDIKKMSRSFLGIVNDILDFAKIEMGKIVLELTHYSLKRLFDNVCSLTQFTLADKHVEFSYYFDPALPSTLYGDEMRVRQILSNILNNAAKYTEHGDVSLKIEHQPHGEENGMLFVISDTGIGIKADTLAIMFEAFSSKQDMKKHGSLDTGLGLAITKRFVDLMGGTITVESEYGKGSVFTIWLPIHLGDESAVELSDSFDCVTASDDSRALVIDDNTINLSVARGFLMKHGIRADTAESGISGIEMTDKTDYDMIFMDHMMPELDGVETTQLLRKKGFSKPIIALTANAIAGAREFFLANGMDDFIAKPIDAAVFNKVLLQWLPKNKIISTKRKQRHDCRVLVLDDSNGARKTLRRSLVGFNVIEKSSVDEFKTIKDNENFNIIILEPEIRGGFFVIDQIRKKNPETPIIAISRNSGIKEYCLSFGVSDFLAKPYKSGQLTDIIQRYLHE